MTSTAPMASTQIAAHAAPVTTTATGSIFARDQHYGTTANSCPTSQPLQSQAPPSVMQPNHQLPFNLIVPSVVRQHQHDRHLPNPESFFPSPRVDVRQVVRDRHGSCLLGSEYHLAFILNAVIHKATPSTLAQAVTNFGLRLVQLTKRQLISHFTAGDLDELADDILSTASSGFLDRALAQRLETIRARSLVNALAKAERLGYDVKDVVEERRDGTEHVVPNVKHHLAQHPAQHEISVVQPTQAKTSMPTTPVSTVLRTPTIKKRNDSVGSPTFLRCNVCNRPVSGSHALRYHKSKHACNNIKTLDRVGKDICPHCGAEFTSSGGLPYHIKSQVCGGYTPSHADIIMPALEEFYRNRAHTPTLTSAHQTESMQLPAQDRHTTQSSQLAHHDINDTTVNSSSAPTTHLATSASRKSSDPYAHLSSEDKARLEAELAQTESHYGIQLRKALKLPQPAQDDEVAKIKNCFNTKQSTTRKKYGVKLRERRTRAEIVAERERLLAVARASDPTQLQERPSSQDEQFMAAKKARVNERGDSVSTVRPAIPSPTADSPRKRVALASMGGLGASAATAEHIDPTAVKSKQSHSPSNWQPANGQLSTTAAASKAPAGGAHNDPVALDDDADTDDSDSEEEDDDIPAVFPKKEEMQAA
ncbi:hypothetical protein NOR_02028 [Metarhizium rileyi]|uniref:C2H2-type domain-containing protein n=1 Tax=Metarhizium rileyi (strain RCEF 4871) TaxID=1649241 RepID=A0A162JT50_METRR|nr:hypothetical protein NOR_02028 [Metarhizium rileyi RCEF 4871]